MGQELGSLLAAVRVQVKDCALLLLLDYDGTLVEIAPRPELARPDPELLQLLARLRALPDLRVMIVSGRTLEELRNLLPVPGLNFLGSHGGECLMGEGGCLTEPGPSLGEISSWRGRLASRLTGCRGWWIENKPLGFALHYRQAGPEEETKILQVLAPWLAEVNRDGHYIVLHGRKVLELLPEGVNKGLAIRNLLWSSGLAGYFLVYIGDDVSGEGISWALSGNGLAVGVGERAGPARYHLADPREVRQFLAALADYWEKRICR